MSHRDTTMRASRTRKSPQKRGKSGSSQCDKGWTNLFNKCCKADKCSAGSGRADECKEDCTPCPQEPFPTFNTAATGVLHKDNRCHICLDCKSIRKKTLEQCTPQKNSVCVDECPDGYLEDSGVCKRTMTTKPLLHYTDVRNSSFGKHGQQRGNTPVVSPVESNYAAHVVLGLCFAAVILLLLVILVFIVMKCIPKKRKCGQRQFAQSTEEQNAELRELKVVEDDTNPSSTHDDVTEHVYDTVQDRSIEEENQLNSLLQRNNNNECAKINNSNSNGSINS